MNPLLLTPTQISTMVDDERAEESRVTLWALLPLAVRELAMLAAKLPHARAADDLTAFTRREREQIAVRVNVLLSHLGVAERCMIDAAPRTTVLH